MGEALLSHPRACHILSVEQKTTYASKGAGACQSRLCPGCVSTGVCKADMSCEGFVDALYLLELNKLPHETAQYLSLSRTFTGAGVREPLCIHTVAQFSLAIANQRLSERV